MNWLAIWLPCQCGLFAKALLVQVNVGLFYLGEIGKGTGTVMAVPQAGAPTLGETGWIGYVTACSHR